MLTNIQNTAELPLWQNKVINMWKNWGDIHFCQFTLLVNVFYPINLSLTTSRFSAEKPSQTNPNTGNPCLILSPVLFVFASFCSFALLDFVLLVKQVPFISSTEAKCSLLGCSPLLLSTTSWCKGQLKSMEEVKPEKTRSLFSPEGSDASLLPSHTHTHIRIITLPPSCSHHITFSCICERLSWAAGNVWPLPLWFPWGIP